jgi:hypothetical protein
MTFSRSAPEPGLCNTIPDFTIRGRLYMKANKKRNIILRVDSPAGPCGLLARLFYGAVELLAPLLKEEEYRLRNSPVPLARRRIRVLLDD